MKIRQCYFNMTLRLSQRKTVCLFISVKLKHAKELTYKVLHLCTCCSCTEKKCHLAEKTRLILNDVMWTLSSCVSLAVIYCTLFSSEENSFHFDRSHTFEEIFFAIAA